MDRLLFVMWQASFHPETALFRQSGVNLRAYSCGIKYYASAQAFDFLAMTKNCSFPILKLTRCHLEFLDGNKLDRMLRAVQKKNFMIKVYL